MDNTLAQILTELYNTKLQLSKVLEELEAYKQSDAIKEEKEDYGNDRGRSSQRDILHKGSE